MEQKKAPLTFEIKIERPDHFTWQGKLLAKDQVITFKSEIELLLAINQLLGGDTDMPCPWNIPD